MVCGNKVLQQKHSPPEYCNQLDVTKNGGKYNPIWYLVQCDRFRLRHSQDMGEIIYS